MGNWGLRITKPGYDVKTESDERNLIYTSKYPTFKVMSQTSLNMNVVYDPVNWWSAGLVSVTHNLGYEPAFSAGIYLGPISGPSFGLYSGGFRMVPIYVGSELSFNAYSTTTQVIFTGKFAGNQEGGNPWSVIIVVFYDIAR